MFTSQTRSRKWEDISGIIQFIFKDQEAEDMSNGIKENQKKLRQTSESTKLLRLNVHSDPQETAESVLACVKKRICVW